MARNAFISVRLSWPLKASLDAAAKSRGWSISQMVQFLLEQGLGASTATATSNAVVRGIQAQLRSKMGSITADLRESVEKHLMSDLGAAEPAAPDDSSDLPDLDTPPPAGMSGLKRRKLGRA